MKKRDIAIVSEVMQRANDYMKTHNCDYGKALINLMPQRIVSEYRNVFNDVFSCKEQSEAMQKIMKIIV